MERQTVSPVMTQVLGQNVLAQYTVGTLIGVTSKLKLFKAGPANPTPLNGVADFTECDFVGYGAKTITNASLTGPVNLPNGNGDGLIQNESFIAGALVAAQSALGYYLTDSTGAILYYAEAFAVAVNFVNPGDFLSLDLILPVLEVGSVS